MAAGLDRGVLLAGDHVGICDHDVGCGHPARALDGEAAGAADHPHDAVRRRRHAWFVGDAGRGGADVRRGPRDRGQRVQPRERVQDRAGGRQQHIQLAQDRRVLDISAQPSPARRLRGDGGEDPHDAQSQHASEGRPEHAVEQPDPRHHECSPQPQPNSLQAACENEARKERPEQAEGGGVGRG